MSGERQQVPTAVFSGCGHQKCSCNLRIICILCFIPWCYSDYNWSTDFKPSLISSWGTSKCTQRTRTGVPVYHSCKEQLETLKLLHLGKNTWWNMMATPTSEGMACGERSWPKYLSREVKEDQWEGVIWKLISFLHEEELSWIRTI